MNTRILLFAIGAAMEVWAAGTGRMFMVLALLDLCAEWLITRWWFKRLALALLDTALELADAVLSSMSPPRVEN